MKRARLTFSQRAPRDTEAMLVRCHGGKLLLCGKRLVSLPLPHLRPPRWMKSRRRSEGSEAEERETSRHGRAARKNKSNAPRRIPLLLSRRSVCFASNVLVKTEKGPSSEPNPAPSDRIFGVVLVIKTAKIYTIQLLNNLRF